MAYLVDDWWRLIPGPAAPVLLALVAVVCGSIVGAERERREKPAGLRTLVLVCLGSSVFTMVSFAFTTNAGDAGRVAAQIVTGIGFLGGGVILRATVGVSGTTTAATIWVTAAMGMVVGAGYAGAGLGLAALIRLALGWLYTLEERWIADLHPTVALLVFRPDHGKTRIQIEKILVGVDDRYEVVESGPDEADLAQLRVRFRLGRRYARELLGELAALPAMHEIREETPAPAAVDARRG